MSWQNIDIYSSGPVLSLWTPVLYYIISIITGVLLLIGKQFVHNYANFTIFILYAFFVVGVGGCQLALFRFGSDFARDVFRIHLDVYAYDSIFWGSFCFAFLYCIAVPTKFK